MNKDRIQAIIFDLGNVLINFDHRIAAEKISKFIPLETISREKKDKVSLTGFTAKSAEEILNLFFDSELTELFEEGKISPLQFFSKVKKMLNLKINYEEFLPIWNEIFFLTEENLAVYNLAHNLKNCYKVALVSNINILHFEYIKKTFPVLNAFHNIITSFEVGSRKPKPQIYQKTLQTLEVSAADCLYIDDRPELVEGAKQLGIRGFVYRGAKQLRKDLIGAGISIN